MKTTGAIAVLAFCSGVMGAPKLRAHVDLSQATDQLQGLMAAAQTSLVQAEKHQEHAVQRARKNLTSLLDREAQALGKAVARYDVDLRMSATQLSSVVNASTVVLKAEEAISRNAVWGEDSASDARAQVGAQVHVAESEVRKAKRQHDHQVRAAMDLVEESLEEHLSKISRRVGDVSPVVDEAKTNLEAEAAHVDTNEAAIGNSSKPANATGNQTGNSTKRLEALVVNLKEATTQHRASVAAAEKRLQEAKASVDKELAAGVASIEQGLEEKEKANIRKVRAAITTPPPHSKKVHKKAPVHKMTAKEEAAQKALVELLKKAFKKGK